MYARDKGGRTTCRCETLGNTMCGQRETPMNLSWDAGAGGRRASSSRGWRWLQIRVGEVAARIGILRAERRPKCIDVGEREAVGLDIKLPRHRQECFTAKKILHEIDLALRRARQVGEVQRRYPE